MKNSLLIIVVFILIVVVAVSVAKCQEKKDSSVVVKEASPELLNLLNQQNDALTRLVEKRFRLYAELKMLDDTIAICRATFSGALQEIKILSRDSVITNKVTK